MVRAAINRYIRIQRWLKSPITIIELNPKILAVNAPSSLSLTDTTRFERSGVLPNNQFSCKRLLSASWTRLDGLQILTKVVVISATNRPDAIDTAWW